MIWLDYCNFHSEPYMSQNFCNNSVSPENIVQPASNNSGKYALTDYNGITPYIPDRDSGRKDVLYPDFYKSKFRYGINPKIQ